MLSLAVWRALQLPVLQSWRRAPSEWWWVLGTCLFKSSLERACGRWWWAGTVRVWEISTKKCLQILEDSGRRWGQFTCLTWLGNWGNDDLKPIAFGTGRGLIVIYRRPRIDVSVAWKLWLVFIDTSKVINGWTGKQPCIWGKRSSWVDSVRHQEISPCNNKPPRSYCHIWYRK